MPLLKLETSVALPDEKRTALLALLSKIVAESIGKPEKYVMVTVNSGAILMSESPENSAFVDVRSIGGLSGDVNRKLSERICTVLREQLGIPGDRVYLNFSDFAASNWGWNGSTFG